MFEQRAQRAMEAVHRKDLVAVMRAWADDSTLDFPGTGTLSGRYEGKTAIEGFFRAWFDRMESIRLTVKHVGFGSPMLTHSGTAFIEFDTDQKTKDGIEFHTEVVGVYRYRRGKVVHYREFLFDTSLIEAVWGSGE